MHHELGAADIAKSLHYNRSLVYSYLDSLIGKGLVSYFLKNNVKYFRAADPEMLQEYLKDKLSEYNKLLPELKKLGKRSKEEISVELYRGKEGAYTLMKDIIRSRSDIDVLGYQGQVEEIMPIYLKQYLRQLTELKIKERILAKKGYKIFKSKRTEVRYLSKEFDLPTSIVIYSNKVLTIIYQEPFYAVLVTSNQVAKTYKNFFNVLWKNAKG
jgi:sugar-specific transcriptional regulator TrmB